MVSFMSDPFQTLNPAEQSAARQAARLLPAHLSRRRALCQVQRENGVGKMVPVVN
jgi:hypothetical protein